jgi:hypothetical protein
MKTTKRQTGKSGAAGAGVRRLTLVLGMALVALMASGSAALALSQRGHVFCQTCTFGTSDEGKLSDPGGIAVSEATGDVYVLDRGHARIVQFGPHGEFLSAWGWGVTQGGSGKGYERCIAGQCNPSGVSGAGKLQFNEHVQAIAVDNCTTSTGKACPKGEGPGEDPSVGDVYVAKEVGVGGEEIVKLSPSGELLERTTKASYREGSGEPERELLEADETHGLTVGPDGTVWLYYDEELYSLSDHGFAAKNNPPPLSFPLEGGPELGVAVDVQGHFYIGQEGYSNSGTPPHVFRKWQVVEGELQEVSEEALDYEDSTAIAVNPLDLPANKVDESDDVYVTNIKSAAGEDSSTVAQFAPSGKAIERFGAPELQRAEGVAVYANTGEVFVTDSATGDVDIFQLEEPGPPTVDGASVHDVTSETAQIDAQIDPTGTPNTSYELEYGTSPCGEAHSSCVKVQGAIPGEGFGDESIVVRLQAGTSAPVAPGTTYHYRILARNEHGLGRDEREGAFTTLPAGGEDTADERVWEMVSPPEKGGALIEALNSTVGGEIQAANDGGAITYVADAPIGETEGNRSVEATQMLSTRGAGGWSSQDIVTPNEHGIGIGGGYPPEYRLFSQDLSLALVQPFRDLGAMAEPPLAPPASEAEKALKAEGKDYQENTLYLRGDQPLEPQGGAEDTLYGEAKVNGEEMGDSAGYLALVNGTNVLPGAKFGELEGATSPPLAILDATPDLSHVVISSLFEASGCTFGELGCTPGLYEWAEGQLRLVSQLDDGNAAVNPVLGSGHFSVKVTEGSNSIDVRHAVSDDGSRIFWSSEGHLYMRDMTKTPAPETLQIDKAQGVAEPKGGAAVFQTASADGSRVFFADTQRLTTGSGASDEPSEEKPDLYVCEIVEGPGHKLECDLTDLTPARHTGEGEEAAYVQGVDLEEDGGVLGASEDGSYVYFVAEGVLSKKPNAEGETAAPGLCQALGPEATCNLYMERYDAEPGQERWEEPTFIARLSLADEPDWRGLNRGRLASALFTSRVSPNGRYLAFMSDRELTGYDNVDGNPEAEGAHDEEVFLYEAGAQAASPGRLICASCDPSGAQPDGVFDPPEGEGDGGPEGVGLLVDRPETWAGKWLGGSIPGWTGLGTHGPGPWVLNQSRYLSNSGRLFFDSPADLVPEATNGKEDVYEYEPAGVPHGVHECSSTSATFDASTGGCIGLISSGTSNRESAFLDASESGGEGPREEEEGGGDVFFVTTAPLSTQDTDTEFDVYDAHECTSGSPCIVPPEEKPPAACEAVATCRPFSYSSSAAGAPASGGSSGEGNLVVLSSTTKKKPKAETSAQKLAKALKSCRVRHKHSRSKRISCEKQARRRYPAKKASEKKVKSDARGSRRLGGG